MKSIGLDVGTTGCKATVMNLNGEAVAYAYQSYDLIIPGQGMAELNAQVVWQSVKDVLKQVAKDHRDDIKAVAVASIGESFVCADGNGAVLGNSMLYSDIRGTEEIADILSKTDAQELFDVTGMPVNAMYTLNKLLWVKKNERVYDRAKYIMLFGDFIAYKLTGQRMIDYSLASRTSMYDHKKKAWAGELMSRYGIDKEKFSHLHASGEAIGPFIKEVADELGLSAGTMLYAGAHDQVCAALGAGVVNDGDCVDGIGTSECITTIVSNVENTDFMLKNNFCTEPYAIPDKYVSLAFYPAAGATINWYKSTIERERNEAFEKQGKDIFAALEAEAPKGASSLFVIPHLAGTGTPYMDSYATGAILGLKLGTTKGEIYKACLEGLCFEIMLNAELLSHIGTNISNMICVGGVSKSDMLMQIKADMMGIPVTRLKVKESGTMALAMLCFVAEKEYKNYGEAAAAMIKKEKTFVPDAKNHEAYLEKYKVYKNIYNGIKQIYTVK